MRLMELGRGHLGARNPPPIGSTRPRSCVEISGTVMWRLLTNRRVLQAATIMGVLLVVALWPEAVEVEVGNVTRGALVVTLDGEGETRVHHRFIVSAPVAGTLEGIELEPGNGVERGKTIVARLRPEAPPPLDARGRAEANAAVTAARDELERARAEEERARAALDVAAQELEREHELFSAGQTTQQSLEARRNIVSSAEETVNAAQYGAAAAEADLERARARLPTRLAPAGKVMELLAPVDGVVLRVLRESDGVVEPGEKLVEIGDPRHLEIVADLPASDAGKVTPGMRVDVENWGGDTPLPAWVERVEPAVFTKSSTGVQEQRVNVTIDFEDDREAWKAMGDGFRVKVRIAIWEEEDVRRVPINALFRDGDQWCVYVVQNGRAHRTIVDVGQQTNTDAEVRNGLRSGQQVVLTPPDTLADNARVAVKDQ
jgi:HlyD family secretion protein